MEVVIPATQQHGEVFTLQITFDNLNKDLNKNTLVVLKSLARALKIKGYSRLNKADMVHLLKNVFVFEGNNNDNVNNVNDNNVNVNNVNSNNVSLNNVKPKLQKPKSQKPKSQKPKSQKPKSQKPKSQKPKSQKPHKNLKM
jgi:hypothetical protein